MGDEVDRHECAVAVPGHADTVGIGDTEAHGFVDGGIGYKLFEVGIVGLLRADDKSE
jgi:hypothetical protein